MVAIARLQVALGVLPQDDGQQFEHQLRSVRDENRVLRTWAGAGNAARC